MLRWTLRASLAALIALAAYGYVTPGPQQAIWPSLHGWSEIAPNVFTDDPEKSSDILALTESADREVAAFFGALKSTPRIVICTKEPCVRQLIRGNPAPRGLTYGAHLIIIAPKGVDQTIITHERTHAELHKMARLSDLWDQRIPAWFDEGLATWLSGAADVTPPTPEDRARIEQVISFRDWGPAVHEMTWQRAYGAAQALVADMAEAKGPEALRTLIAQVEGGEPFDVLRAELLSSVDK